MSNLLTELELKEVVTTNIALDLKNYISMKNYNLSLSMKADIFADAVNKIVDAKIPNLTDEQKKQLKRFLFKDAAKKTSFSIDCADILKAVLRLRTFGNLFFTELNKWFDKVLDNAVTRESVFEFVIHSYRMMDEFPDLDISDIVNAIEEKMGGDSDKTKRNPCIL